MKRITSLLPSKKKPIQQLEKAIKKLDVEESRRLLSSIDKEAVFANKQLLNDLMVPLCQLERAAATDILKKKAFDNAMTIAKLLIDHGADTQTADAVLRAYVTSIHPVYQLEDAISRLEVDTVRKLLSTIEKEEIFANKQLLNIAVQGYSYHGNTIEEKANRVKSVDIITLLINHGADVNIREAYHSPLPPRTLYGEPPYILEPLLTMAFWKQNNNSALVEALCKGNIAVDLIKDAWKETHTPEVGALLLQNVASYFKLLPRHIISDKLLPYLDNAEGSQKWTKKAPQPPTSAVQRLEQQSATQGRTA